MLKQILPCEVSSTVTSLELWDPSQEDNCQESHEQPSEIEERETWEQGAVRLEVFVVHLSEPVVEKEFFGIDMTKIRKLAIEVYVDIRINRI